MTQVVALKQGFYGGSRRRVGDIFEMKERRDEQGKPIKGPNGKDLPVLPSWVKAAPHPGQAKAEAAAAKAAEQKRLADGAKAASGGAAARKKIDEANSLV